jgi:spermidine synthase
VVSTSPDEELPPVTVSEGGGVRCLHLGSIWIQGAMRIAEPQAIELEYVQRMMASLLWHDAEPLAAGRALQLGLGAAAITKFTHKRLRMPTTVVELNPQVIDVCRRWFHLPRDDARLTVVQDDAAHWLAAAAPQSVTLLHVDLYDHEAAAPVLDDAAFYAACRAVLEDGGTMSVNLFGRRASFARSAAHIAAAFGWDRLWSLRPTREGNTVVVAARDTTLPTRSVLLQRAATIEQRFGLPARKWLRLLRPVDPGPDA